MQERWLGASRTFFAYAAVAVPVGVLIGHANAARPPTHSERVRIVAVTKSRVIDSEVRRVEIEKIRVSTVDRHWARVNLEMFGHGGNGPNTGLGPRYVLLYRDVYGYWRVLYEVDPEVDDQTPWFRMGCLVTPDVCRDLAFVCQRRG